MYVKCCLVLMCYGWLFILSTAFGDKLYAVIKSSLFAWGENLFLRNRKLSVESLDPKRHFYLST